MDRYFESAGLVFCDCLERTVKHAVQRHGVLYESEGNLEGQARPGQQGHPDLKASQARMARQGKQGHGALKASQARMEKQGQQGN